MRFRVAMRVLLFDMMDTLLCEPYFGAMERLLADPAGRAAFFEWRERSAFYEFEEGRISEPEYFRRFYKPDTPPEIRAALPRPERVKKEILRNLRYRTGVLELLSELRQRPDLKLGLASNYGAWYHDILRKKSDLELDFLFFSCELAVRKPEAGYYAKILEALQSRLPALEPGHVFFADDREENVRAAEAAGWTAAWIQSEDDLPVAVARFLAESPGEGG